MPFHARFLAPFEHRHTCHLSAIIADNHVGLSSPFVAGIQLTRHAQT